MIFYGDKEDVMVLRLPAGGLWREGGKLNRGVYHANVGNSVQILIFVRIPPHDRSRFLLYISCGRSSKREEKAL